MLYGRFIQSKQVDKIAPFHDPLKTLNLKTLASDCVIKKDVRQSPHSFIMTSYICYVHPLIVLLS